MQNSSPQLSVSPPLQTAFRLGAWRVDPGLNRLQDPRGVIPERSLEPRLMHLLCFLAANRQQTLTRETLTRQLWPNVIVNENSLTRAVSELRKQLDSGVLAGSHYVQTVSKRGYRLDSTLEFSNQIVDPMPLAVVASGRSWRRHWGAPLASAASLVLLFSLSLFQLPAQAPSVPVLAADPGPYDRVLDNDRGFSHGVLTLSGATDSKPGNSKLTDLQSSAEKPALSNDGKTLAVIHYDDQGSTIYLDSVDSMQAPVQIFSSNEYLYNLSWSPVGHALLFASRAPGPTAALLTQQSDKASLLMLNLENLELKVLLDNSGKTPTEQVPVTIHLT